MFAWRSKYIFPGGIHPPQHKTISTQQAIRTLALPATLYRMKGFVRLDDKRFFINHVGGRTEWIEQDLPGATKLAFVGWQVDEGRVIDELKSCLVQTPAE